MSREQFYAVRRFTSGKVCGSPVYDKRADAEREVELWREHVGRAAVVPATRDTAHAVRIEDQDALRALLDEYEPKVWVSVTSYRARSRLLTITGDMRSYYRLPPGTHQPRGDYFEVPVRLLKQVRCLAGVHVLQQEPRDLFPKPVARRPVSLCRLSA